MDIENKVALVLGAARGIGRAYCESLLQKGAKVSFCDLLAHEGKQTEDEFQERFGNDRVKFQSCDCSKYDELERVFHDTIASYGTIDIVVCNIGILNERKWRETIAANMSIPLMVADLTQWLLGKDKGGQGAVFVCTASIAAQQLLFIPVYSASKAGLVHYIRSASVSSEYQRHGIKMLALCPDAVKTAFLEDISPSKVRYYDIISKNVEKHLENGLSPHQVGEALVTCLENPKLGPGAVVNITNDGLKVLHSSSP